MTRLQSERLRPVAGRLWRRPGPGSRQSDGCRRDGAASMGLRHPLLPGRCRARRAATPASTTISRSAASIISAPGSSAGTCSGRCAGPGRTGTGKGWWGDTPPYRCPVFVLTHHARADLEMAGGTVFHFVTGGIEEAWERAQAAAGGRDVRLGGGTETVRQYLQAGLLDSLHLAVVPRLMGKGEALFAGLDLPALGYQVRETVAGEGATHVVLSRTVHSLVIPADAGTHDRLLVPDGRGPLYLSPKEPCSWLPLSRCGVPSTPQPRPGDVAACSISPDDQGGSALLQNGDTSVFGDSGLQLCGSRCPGYSYTAGATARSMSAAPPISRHASISIARASFAGSPGKMV